MFISTMTLLPPGAKKGLQLHGFRPFMPSAALTPQFSLFRTAQFGFCQLFSFLLWAASTDICPHVSPLAP